MMMYMWVYGQHLVLIRKIGKCRFIRAGRKLPPKRCFRRPITFSPKAIVQCTTTLNSNFRHLYYFQSESKSNILHPECFNQSPLEQLTLALILIEKKQTNYFFPMKFLAGTNKDSILFRGFFFRHLLAIIMSIEACRNSF